MSIFAKYDRKFCMGKDTLCLCSSTRKSLQIKNPKLNRFQRFRSDGWNNRNISATLTKVGWLKSLKKIMNKIVFEIENWVPSKLSNWCQKSAKITDHYLQSLSSYLHEKLNRFFCDLSSEATTRQCSNSRNFLKFSQPDIKFSIIILLKN